MKNRIIGLDIFRIMAAFFVFLFHSKINYKCSYSILNPFISMGAIYMTAFFLMSGFVLFYTYKEVKLHSIKNIRDFYFRRLIGIMPVYYVVALLYTFVAHKETLYETLLLVPIEILGLQSLFHHSLFLLAHNGGTWFISCLLICYLVYPYIQELVKQLSLRIKLVIILINTFILLYSPFIVKHFKSVSIYDDPFFRALEFGIGVVLCSIITENMSGESCKWLFTWKAFILEYIILIVGVSAGINFGIERGNFMMYNWIALPVFMFQICTVTGLRLPKIFHVEKLILFLSGITYCFFLAQFFVWRSSRLLVGIIGGVASQNKPRIIIAFSICTIYSILLHELIENPISRFLRKKSEV